ncbi:hypothetical protein HAX54_024378, partial [Datura stramonium]|nr:hypothetical protein [Datura stramonium]
LCIIEWIFGVPKTRDYILVRVCLVQWIVFSLQRKRYGNHLVATMVLYTMEVCCVEGKLTMAVQASLAQTSALKACTLQGLPVVKTDSLWQKSPLPAALPAGQIGTT